MIPESSAVSSVLGVLDGTVAPEAVGAVAEAEAVAAVAEAEEAVAVGAEEEERRRRTEWRLALLPLSRAATSAATFGARTPRDGIFSTVRSLTR